MLTNKTRVSHPGRIRAQTKPEVRKQPVQERSRETVAVILEAAARVLEREGLNGYNTNAIATRAGVSIGSVYQYFPNKDSLTMALIEKFERELLNAARTAAAQAHGKDLRRTLALVIRQLLRAHLNRASLNRLLELEEDRLRRSFSDHNTTGELQQIVASLLKQHAAKIKVPVNTATVQDLVTIARAMIDTALLKDTPA